MTEQNPHKAFFKQYDQCEADQRAEHGTGDLCPKCGMIFEVLGYRIPDSRDITGEEQVTYREHRENECRQLAAMTERAVKAEAIAAELPKTRDGQPRREGEAMSDNCPKCGAGKSAKLPPISTGITLLWECGSYRNPCSAVEEIIESMECLRHQLAAMTEKWKKTTNLRHQIDVARERIVELEAALKPFAEAYRGENPMSERMNIYTDYFGKAAEVLVRGEQK